MRSYFKLRIYDLEKGKFFNAEASRRGLWRKSGISELLSLDKVRAV